MWIVWCPHGPTPPKITHTSEAEARVVARKMAKRHPGCEFHVMESKSVHQVQMELLDFWPHGGVTAWPARKWW